MILKSLTKNPILIIGVICSFLFIYQLKQKGYLGREKLNPTSCKAVLVKLDRRIPENWKTKCLGNNLEIVIDHKIPPAAQEKAGFIRALVYRELANIFTNIAKHSPSDNLERTEYITVKLNTNYGQVNALTEGKYMSKLITIKDKELLAQHFQATIKVQEKLDLELKE